MITALASVPVQPGRAQARELLRRELAGREYAQARPGLLTRGIQWLWDRLDGLQLPIGGSLRPALTAITLTVVLAGLAYVVYRSGGLARRARLSGPPVLGEGGRSAADHRAEADRLAAAGDWDGAVVARFRAIARSLEERELLSEQPGRTALEVARDAGAVLPGLSRGLTSAAGVFDQVSYGARHVGEDAYASVRALDEQLAGART